MQGPYAFINDHPKPYPLLKLSLSLNPHAQTKFDTLNQHARNTVVLPGQLVIMGDSRTASCTAEEALLMRSAQQVKRDLLVLGVSGASVGGTLGSLGGVAACAMVFGVPTAVAGALACAIVGGAAGGFALGTLGSDAGELAGKVLYRAVEN